MTVLPGLPQPRIAKVDCGACRKCCKNSLILLQGDESPVAYQCYEFQPGVYALNQKANGECVYLGPQGCTIWGRHPVVCRVFDCAAFVSRMDEGAFDAIGELVDNDVTAEGRKRLANKQQRDQQK